MSGRSRGTDLLLLFLKIIGSFALFPVLILLSLYLLAPYIEQISDFIERTPVAGAALRGALGALMLVLFIGLPVRFCRQYRAKHPSKDYTPKQPDPGELHISDVVHPGRPVQPQPYNRLIRPECQPRPQRVVPKDSPDDTPRYARPLVPSNSRKDT